MDSNRVFAPFFLYSVLYEIIIVRQGFSCKGYLSKTAFLKAVTPSYSGSFYGHQTESSRPSWLGSPRHGFPNNTGLSHRAGFAPDICQHIPSDTAMDIPLADGSAWPTTSLTSYFSHDSIMLITLLRTAGERLCPRIMNHTDHESHRSWITMSL